MGVAAEHDSNDVNYYSLIDLQEIGGTLYGPEFKAWFIKSDIGISFLFRLADETGVVLLPGNGFEGVDTSARVSRQSDGDRIRLDRLVCPTGSRRTSSRLSEKHCLVIHGPR